MPICRWTWTSTRRSPLLDAQGLEQSLLFGDGELDVAGDEVGELAGLGDGVEHLVHDFLGEPAALAELRRPLARLLVEGGEGRVVLVERLHLLDRHDHGAEIPVAVPDTAVPSARCSPCSSSWTPPKPALDLADPGDDAHRVEDVRRRLVGVVALRDGEDEPVPLERGSRSHAGCPVARRAIGAVSPGKITVPRRGRTGRVCRSAMIGTFYVLSSRSLTR